MFNKEKREPKLIDEVALEGDGGDDGDGDGNGDGDGDGRVDGRGTC